MSNDSLIIRLHFAVNHLSRWLTPIHDVRRLERLENLALEFNGVERVFALQAGREVRVVVDPGEVTDLEANDLARRIARKLEEDLQYPGTIQVTVIREFRATDYAR